jgi:hypothetical protein
MTEPRLERRNYGRGHGYKIDGQKVLGVTTALQVIAKPALIDWAARATAEAAVDRWDELAELPISERLKELNGARWVTNKAAILRGNEIHALAEKLTHGQPVDVPPEHVGPVEAYAKFLDHWQLEAIGTEAPCANTDIGYAGTLDAVMRTPLLNDGQPILLDNKTGKGVYSETALQLAAYARCTLWQPEGQGSEEPMLEVAGLYVAHVLADDVRMVPILDDIDKLFLRFRWALALARWEIEAKEDNPIGAAL